MGIIPLFDLGEANALFFMEIFTLINKARSRIKVFETFDDSSKNPSIVVSFYFLMVVWLNEQVSQL